MKNQISKTQIKYIKICIAKNINYFFVFGLCFLFFIFSFWFLYAQEMPVTPKSEEVKGFVMTIVDKGGKEKAIIAGGAANILQGGLIEILEVVARIYGETPSGADTLVHTSKGIYNKFQNIISTDQFVRINRRDMVVTGTGLKWEPDRSKLRIDENVKVEYFYNQKTETQENAGSEKKVTVITSRGNGKVDYNKNVAVLEKNVVIEDINVVLKANKMKIFFDGETQSLIRVEAYGNVRIKQPKRESLSQKAVYFVEEDKVILTKSPKIVQGLDFYTADKVTIYEKGNRVVFEPKARLVIYASTEHEM